MQAEKRLGDKTIKPKGAEKIVCLKRGEEEEKGRNKGSSRRFWGEMKLYAARLLTVLIKLGSFCTKNEGTCAIVIEREFDETVGRI